MICWARALVGPWVCVCTQRAADFLCIPVHKYFTHTPSCVINCVRTHTLGMISWWTDSQSIDPNDYKRRQRTPYEMPNTKTIQCVCVCVCVHACACECSHGACAAQHIRADECHRTPSPMMATPTEMWVDRRCLREHMQSINNLFYYWKFNYTQTEWTPGPRSHIAANGPVCLCRFCVCEYVRVFETSDCERRDSRTYASVCVFWAVTGRQACRSWKTYRINVCICVIVHYRFDCNQQHWLITITLY